MASVQNNLGFALALQGQYLRGELHCKKAIDIWLQLGTKEIGRGETTLAAIYRDRAITNLQKIFSTEHKHVLKSLMIVWSLSECFSNWDGPSGIREKI